jgi:outer membrane immunogenic protein
MTRLLRTALLASAAIALPLAAQAADLRQPVYKAPPPVLATSWTGFYFGLHGGAGWGTKTFDYNDLTPAAPFLWNSSVPVNGPLAGGQIGFNWQAGWLVLGIEADGSWADINGRSLCNSTVFFLNCSAKTSSLATVTGRLGFSFDHALIYAKGGAAWARDSFTISNVALPPLVTAFSSSLSDTRSGWTIGMGVEYMFANAWSAKVEYDYMDLGTKRYNFTATSAVVPAATFTNWDDTQRIHVMKVGINYHFGAAGVLAAY